MGSTSAGSIAGSWLRIQSLWHGGSEAKKAAYILANVLVAPIVKRTVYPTVPPKVEYELTGVGRSLIEPLSTLAAWADANLPAIEAAHTTCEE